MVRLNCRLLRGANLARPTAEVCPARTGRGLVAAWVPEPLPPCLGAREEGRGEWARLPRLQGRLREKKYLPAQGREGLGTARGLIVPARFLKKGAMGGGV